MTPEQAFDFIFNELKKAEKKHPAWTYDAIHASAILNEEAGELTQAAIDFTYTKDHAAEKQKMIIEAAQTGAMAIRFLCGIDNYHPDVKHFEIKP